MPGGGGVGEVTYANPNSTLQRPFNLNAYCRVIVPIIFGSSVCGGWSLDEILGYVN